MKENKDRPPALVVFVLALFVFAATAGFEKTEVKTDRPQLPQTVGSWTKTASPRTVTADDIFGYMDGAGELYIGYRFDRLEVTEYESPGEKDILVELYFMKTPDDAFGLLSLDWGGEPVDLGNPSPESAEKQPPWPKALYGEGLLRLRSDTIYARIMAEQETPPAKEAVLALGRAVVKDRADSSGPGLLRNLPEILGPGWRQRRSGTSFFRSYLVLNSLYYLSPENMFDLGRETAAAIARYEKESPAGLQRIRVLVIRYPEVQAAERALAHFRRVYLPDQESSSNEAPNFCAVEDGWLGYKADGRRAVFVFECPDRETAAAAIDQL